MSCSRCPGSPWARPELFQSSPGCSGLLGCFWAAPGCSSLLPAPPTTEPRTPQAEHHHSTRKSWNLQSQWLRWPWEWHHWLRCVLVCRAVAVGTRRATRVQSSEPISAPERRSHSTRGQCEATMCDLPDCCHPKPAHLSHEQSIIQRPQAKTKQNRASPSRNEVKRSVPKPKNKANLVRSKTRISF